jgi:Spy/CpxP family protein refolding chaperone
MTSFVRRSLAVAVSAAALTMIVSSNLPLGAQEPRSGSQADSKTKAKGAKKAFDPARRVPAYFGQLGLSDEQRESIYKVQGKHMPKIDALEKQIEQVRGEMLRECEAVLTPEQKKLLEQRRAAGAESRSRKASPAKPQS